jgi:hypothetical protein
MKQPGDPIRIHQADWLTTSFIRVVRFIVFAVACTYTRTPLSEIPEIELGRYIAMADDMETSYPETLPVEVRMVTAAVKWICE